MDCFVKKNWLYSFFSLLLMLCLLSAISTSITAKAIIFAASLLGCATYYLGYKKPGTKWLFLVISVRIFGFTVFITQMLYLWYTDQFFLTLETASTTTSVSVNTYGTIALSGTLISLYYTYWCYRLRKSNIKLPDKIL